MFNINAVLQEEPNPQRNFRFVSIFVSRGRTECMHTVTASSVIVHSTYEAISPGSKWQIKLILTIKLLFFNNFNELVHRITELVNNKEKRQKVIYSGKMTC